LANCKSVQKGVFTLEAAENMATVTLATAVDPTKTILFKGGICIVDEEEDRPSHTNIMVGLTNATTITFERIDSHSAKARISWYVVEFEKGVLVERGTEYFSGQSTKTDGIDNATDLSKSFCLISYKTDGHNFGPDDFCRARILDDGGQKKVEMSFAGATVGKVDWQVIEIQDGGEVQSGLVTLAGNKATRDVDITAVDLTESFLIFSYKVDGEATPDALALRGYISETNKLTFERNSGSSGISADISWFVVQMTDGTSVQQKDISLDAGDEKGNTAIDPVTVDETSVHIGSLQQFGKNERNVDEFGKAMITVDLESPTKVSHERGQANSATGIWTFYVIHWAESPRNLAVFKLSLSEKISARNLVQLIDSIDKVYLGHFWLDSVSKDDVVPTAPELFQPKENETLYIRKLEIGTPNLVELIGLSPYLANATAVVAAGFGIARLGIKLIKEGVETIKKVKEIEIQKIEKAKKELDTKKLSLELVEKANKLYLEGTISKEQFMHINQIQAEAVDVTRNISKKIASEPEFTVIEK